LGWLYSYLEEDKAKLAIEHLTRAIALNPEPSVRLYRSLVYLSQNKHALAMEDCELTLSVEPNNGLDGVEDESYKATDNTKKELPHVLGNRTRA
jgi:tetratricopeptide (TPR) repeat protein